MRISVPMDWNEAGLILKKLFIVYGALKVSENVSKGKKR
jgi:hypothetical protein